MFLKFKKQVRELKTKNP